MKNKMCSSPDRAWLDMWACGEPDKKDGMEEEIIEEEETEDMICCKFHICPYKIHFKALYFENIDLDMTPQKYFEDRRAGRIEPNEERCFFVVEHFWNNLFLRLMKTKGRAYCIFRIADIPISKAYLNLATKDTDKTGYFSITEEMKEELRCFEKIKKKN